MSLQWYAPFVVLAGLVLWVRGSLVHSIVALMFFSLFGGGAALLIGMASIQPAYFFLIFLLAHALLLMFRRTDRIAIGLKTNGYLALFCLYGFLTAFILPKIFYRSMYLPPMLIGNSDVYMTAPVGPSKQNITTAIYLIGTLVVSVCAGAAAADPKSRRTIVTWSLVFAWIHVAFGVLGVIATKIGAEHLLSFFRNAKYAQLTEVSEGFVRVNGIFPEPSQYGAYAFCWFVFATELWLRHVRPLWTGATAAALALTLAACTSTATYFGLAGYGAIMLARWTLASGGLRTSKLVLVALGLLSALCAVLAAAAFVPEIATVLGRVLQSFTVHKLNSSSGEQRLFWAGAGIKAFVGSYGLGVGAGTFRCSSLLLAVMGSMGVVGVVTFAAHLSKILRPLHTKTYRLAIGSDEAVGVAAAWAACAGLLPPMVAAPTPDPEILFSVFGGLALGWRYLAEGDRALRARLPRARSAYEGNAMAGARST